MLIRTQQERQKCVLMWWNPVITGMGLLFSKRSKRSASEIESMGPMEKHLAMHHPCQVVMLVVEHLQLGVLRDAK